MWRGINIFNGSSVIAFLKTACKSPKLKLELCKTEIKKYYKLGTQGEGETGKQGRKWRRSERKGKEEGMRAEGGRSAPAVPWASREPRISSLEKLSFFLWKILQTLSSTQLLFTHTHPLSHSLTYEDRHSILQCFAHSSSHHYFALSGPVPTANQDLADRTKSAARGRWGHRIEEVASPVMHGSGHDQTCSVWFSLSHPIPLSSFCLAPFIYLSSFYRFSSTPFLPPSLPHSASSCPTVRALGL